MRQPLSAPRALLLIILAVATACPSRTPPEPGVRATQQPRSGGTLRAAFAEDPVWLDPHRAASPPAWFFARALHRGLLAFPGSSYPEGAEPVGDLAARVDVSDDRRTYTFSLRDVRFGRPVSRALEASDVVASIARVLRVDRGVARSLWVIDGAEAYARGRAPSARGVRADGSRRVVVTLSRPAHDVLSILAHPQLAIVPRGLAVAAQPPERIVGLGPYRLERYEPERRATLVRNEAWSDDEVRGAHIDRIEAQLAIGRDGAIAAVVSGRADIVTDPGPPDLGPIRASGAEVRVTRVAGPCVRYAFAGPRVSSRAWAAVAAAARSAAVPANAARAGGLLPPVVFGSGDEPPRGNARPSVRGAGVRLVVGDGARDRADAAALRVALERLGAVVTVARVPAAVAPDVNAAASTSAGIATWCADWPGLAGRAVLGPIAGVGVTAPAPACPRARPAIAATVAGAVAAPAEAAPARYAALSARMRQICRLEPWYFPPEEVVHRARVRGVGPIPMFPTGDPTTLWLDG